MRNVAAILSTLPALVRAHDGHGAFGQHLHPGEWLGVVALAAVLVGAVLHFWRR